MNKIPNRQAICDVLMEKAKEDKDIVVLCSDSRGSLWKWELRNRIW